MNVEELDRWWPPDQQQQRVAQLIQRVGLTRIRAESFVRLWIYALVEEQLADNPRCQPPLADLVLPTQAIICTHRQAAELFYFDKEQGSDRAAGMMLDKLAALGLIHKHFDGNTTWISIQPMPEGWEQPEVDAPLQADDFDPRCDAIPVANLLARNYNWMNRNSETAPHRITQLLRQWAQHYPGGMRVLRRLDTQNPMGFYLLYPTASVSDINFFSAPSKGLHLSTMTEVDPFQMATPGDLDCVSVFVRSWMIEPLYWHRYQVPFLLDTQQTLQRMQQDFPNLCDLHTLVIHPQYEQMGALLGFQKTSQDSTSSVYWMYRPLDRFLAFDLQTLALDNDQ
ncbi:MAG: hypothetical protein HC851_23455 [Acaryochloris sp. RU_4_1]|nr:hypothetical protein [Acaryochloris sp. RU_4_1]NJR57097.1 hypothetical protein [Acaryochloris sp. CRU_2_0]